MADSTRYVGTRRPRIDSREKVIGATRYSADLTVPGLLHARIVPSLHAHARIMAVDAAAALALPGVVAVLTARDLPIVGHGEERRYEPLARDVAVFAGQPVALVIGETETAAEDAVDLVQVDVESLAPFVDVAAIDPDADEASVHVLSRGHEHRGDVESAFARCDATVEGRFRVSWAYQAYLEPHAATAWIEPDGTLAVTASTQGTFLTRNELAQIFGLPPSKVRVTAAALGGAFGGKQVVIEPLVAGAALRLRKPVRLVLNRREDFAATNPAQGMVIDLRIGAGRLGRFEALEARMTYDAGAYTESSWEWFAAQLITGPYRWPAFDVRAFGVRTNRFGAGNYRAPTGPSGVFALELLVDELCVRLELDPVDVRAANTVVEGDPMVDDDPWPRIGAIECLDRLSGHPMWTGRRDLPPGEGVGLAIGVWLGAKEPAAATCRLEPDGTITVITGVVDMSGATSAFATIAAETFGLPVEAVSIVTADTTSAPPSPTSNASAITYASGPAVQAAVAEARDRLLHVAADEFEIEPADLEIIDGIVRPRGSPEVGRPVAEFAKALSEAWGGSIRRSKDTPPPPRRPSRHRSPVISPTSASMRRRVVKLVGYAVVQDVGRALNPALIEGQMVGGAVQSIGRALYEELIHDDRGQLLTGTFLDYAVPKAAMLPPIDTLIVEVPAPDGPFGAKGIGEASILPGPAAIANAVAAATSLRMRELPMTARRIWAATKSTKGPGAPS